MNDNKKIEVVAFLGGSDLRCCALSDAIMKAIDERGCNMSIPSILGVLRLIEHELITGEK